MDSNIIPSEYGTVTSSKLSGYFTKRHFEEQIERIKNASELAQKKIDYPVAHNKDTLYAIEIVEDFLRKTKRICYGGQAINAHLPKAHKIYDPNYSIPDYDFFTLFPEKDIRELTIMLQRAGFPLHTISIREGMHEGTMKVYVDYIPVADITAIHPRIFEILYKRSATFDGIHYLDANSLRMLMYVELSRPRGEVHRWPKVFERLMMFNEFIPIKRCSLKQSKTMLTDMHIKIITQYIIDHDYIFAGADLVDFYNRIKSKTSRTRLTVKDIPSTKNTVHLHISRKKPILFYSNDSTNDAKELVKLFQSIDRKKYRIETITIDKSDIVPYFTVIKYNRQIIACIINYSACHSYITITSSKGIFRIASLDTLISLYFSLGLLHTRAFNIGSMECMANKLVEISMKTRERSGTLTLPFISINCQGYQKSLPSLIREKVKRITEKRAANKKQKTIKKRR